MDAISFARSAGLAYLHAPFSHIRHADRPMEDWVVAWETLFNLGAGEAACRQQRKVVSYSHNSEGLKLCFGWSHRSDELCQNFRAMIPEFRRKYYLNKAPRATEEVTLAVHIRRGYDISPNDYLFTSTDSVLRTIRMVKAVLDTHSIRHRISVYSEGNSADFAEICIPGVELSKYRVGHCPEKLVDAAEVSHPSVEFLDVDAAWAMRELIEAEVLIMSKSSFSYYAALISDGVKIGDPSAWYLSPMDDWIPCLADGSFNLAAFQYQLSLLIKARTIGASG